jgi:hypothetical protein
VAVKDGRPELVIQVAYAIAEPTVLERELAGLRAASAELPGATPLLLAADFALPEARRPAELRLLASWLLGAE